MLNTFAAVIATVLMTCPAGRAATDTVKVFILAGQSNMEGKAANSLLDYQAEAPATRDLFKHLRKDGKWIVRDDVFIKFLDRKGPLTVGFGSPGCTGVELEFGTLMGGHYQEPVLLIKTAWGGHSLYKSFRSPSAGYPGARLQVELEARRKQVAQDNEKKQRNDPPPTVDDIKKEYGSSYRAMLAEVRETCAKIETLFPELKGKRPEIAGFVWFQGWNDMNAGGMDKEYASNMKCLIEDVRKDLNAPKLPFVIAAMGQNGSKPADGELLTIREAQLSMNDVPEFKGNVKAFRTDLLADKEAERLIDGWEKHPDEWKKVGSNWGFHYLGSAIWFNRIGKAMGDAMLDLIDPGHLPQVETPPTEVKPASRALTLATRGQPAAYTIVRPAKASPSQVFAAEELQQFTEQMTGVKLPISTDDAPLPDRAVLLGETKYTAGLLGGTPDLTSLGEDGFRLKSAPPHLLIVGGPARGTLYGVYELLEHYGKCRWYSSWHSVIPHLDAWTISALDETQRPAIAMREPFWFDMFDGDLAARNKVNGASMRLQEKHGGKIRFGTGCMVHTFHSLVPPDEFFATHPEYFSEIGGKRVKNNAQLCLTNPDVLKIVTERLLERIRKDPGAKLFSVSQNDCLNFCTCAACKEIDTREGTHAGTMISFVNQVAEAVEREFPDVWIETLAYNETRTPPKTVRPRNNVVVRLCSIECEFSKPFDRGAGQNRKFVDEMNRWSAMTDKLHIWDYVTDFRDYLGPFPNVLALQGNVKFFRDHHVVGVFEEGAYQGRHADFAELKAWLLAKWLWNPDLPAEPLLNDFFTGYYGAAAPQVRRYFDEVHAFYQKPGATLSIYDDVLRQPPVTADFYTHAVDLWRQAEAAVKDTPAYSYNVRMGAIPALFAHFSRLPAESMDERRALAADLLARFNEAKDIWISESAEIHRNTVAQWTRLSQPVPPPATPPAKN